VTSERRAQRQWERQVRRRVRQLDRETRRRTRPYLGGPLLPSLVIALVLSSFIMLRDPGMGGYRLRHLLGLDHRVEAAVEPPPQRGHYAFTMTQPGSHQPVGWDPCSTIPYVVNPDGAPDDWQDLVADGTHDLEQATGLRFRDGGTTGDRDFRDRTGLFGKPEPVLIGWATETEMPDLAGDVAGLGGSAAIESRPGHLTYVTGMVALDRDYFAQLDEAGDRTEMRAILDHELGHVVGLAHVHDRGELMYDDNVGRTTFGPGDLQGLARVGAVDCG
jgi:hypothetical protein